MAHAIIVNHPARTAASATRRPEKSVTRGAVALALATPVLGILLAWGLVDACAFTQHSLMGIYAASSPASA